MATLIDVRDRPIDQSDLPARDEIANYHLFDELRLVGGLIERAVYTEDERRRIRELARELVEGVRAGADAQSGIDAFMREYGFSSEEGVILMCLAEALLRIPDADTADAFIADKIGSGDWNRHLGHSDSLFVNASTWGLLLTGRIVKLSEKFSAAQMSGLFNRLIKRSGEPVIRNALRQAMRVMGDQFVLGRTIQEALKRARPLESEGYLFSYDMLGEAARTARDAERYHRRYIEALQAVGRVAGPLFDKHADAIFKRPSLSIKLSAIHPRYEPGREEQLRDEVLPKLIELAADARDQGIGITIDAEEQDRLEVMLWLFGELCREPRLAGWHGLGLAVQAYSKRAIPTLRWLRRISHQGQRRIPVRLVKGAYWDSEIKWAQEHGFADYPVFTRKLHTDVSYLACMRLLLSDRDAFYPQFATHNAQTLATAAIAGSENSYEFQRLHGMGEALYDRVLAHGVIHQPCRIYAPVGGHEDLLAYLVRRLLENGANTSFINRLADNELPVSEIVADPVGVAEQDRETGTAISKLAIPRPPVLFGEARRNSLGLPLSETSVRERVLGDMAAAFQDGLEAGPIINGDARTDGDEFENALCPHDRRQRLGRVVNSAPDDIEQAVVGAADASYDWNGLGGDGRARLLERVADLYERDRARLMAVIVREAGKTLENAQGDLREAVDFLRYYASEARRLFTPPRDLPGPTGETNSYALQGRGLIACISPWNFPLAIFTGQIAGALAAGNTVLAKPAEQTPMTAFMAARLFHEAGVPPAVLQLLPGDGRVGAKLVSDRRVRGVVFTGSNETAWAIQKGLSERRSEIVPFVAETGGINAMIVDSSALPEQVTRDVVQSAFDSAGQRCSATRILFLQDDVADKFLEMLVGATEALRVGDPIDYATDVGPVIDQNAVDTLEAHKARLNRSARKLVDVRLPDSCHMGTFVTPAIYEIAKLSDLTREVFGPILHVVRFEAERLDQVCAAINESGFALTLGIHSRIQSTADYIVDRTQVGNVYVNRNQIGAVVGVQPFGGSGLSGTGPKAGGPEYLGRLALERVVSNDITATGGNVQLLSLGGTAPSSGED
ncbi:MAG: bifunctional proline dehydrogenase/L-glutamate gamma-semialdehyde dehydrogenase PutA [Hyphomicrobiaceae bacterium]